jgi:hypothetical protein
VLYFYNSVILPPFSVELDNLVAKSGAGHFEWSIYAVFGFCPFAMPSNDGF